jgi:hypothetical protein
VQAKMDSERNLVVEGFTPRGAVTTETNDVQRMFGTFADPAGSRVEMLHLFMLDDAKEASYNASVLALLRTEITTVLASNVSACVALERIFAKEQHMFAQTDMYQPPSLKFVKVGEQEWRVQHVEKGVVTTKNVPAKALQLPSFLTIGSDDLQYNVVQLIGKLASKGKQEERIMYGVQIVLPGLTPEAVAAIKAQMKWSGNGKEGAAIRMEPSEAGRRTLAIDFETTELLATPALMTKLQDKTESEQLLVNEMLLTEGTIVSEGTRPIFDVTTKSRKSRVQIRVGVEKVATMQRPLMAYNDGVLTIVIASTLPPPKASPPAAAEAASTEAEE